MSRNHRLPAPDLPAPSLHDGADERWLLMIWLAEGTAGRPLPPYRPLRRDYEEVRHFYLPARIPKRFRDWPCWRALAG